MSLPVSKGQGSVYPLYFLNEFPKLGYFPNKDICKDRVKIFEKSLTIVKKKTKQNST